MIMINLGTLTGWIQIRGRSTKLTLTCSKFGNLTGTYPGIQAAFCEPGGTAPELKAIQ